jgi:tetratricopeptide (TPR) repeat protein
MSKKTIQQKHPTTTMVLKPSILKVFLLLLILVIYGRTTKYEFTLDDDLFVINNPTVQKGISGISEAFSKGSLEHFRGSNFQIYRPGSISLLCIEKQFFGNDPAGFHFMNIVLYAIIGLIVLSILNKLFPGSNPYVSAAILCLFITHPIHTEVVASIKSQDELLGSLFCLTAWLYLLKSYEVKSKERYYLIISILSFFASLFSKESSFAFLAIFPITVFLIKKENIKKSTLFTLPYLAVGILFLILRYVAIQETNIAYETSKLENVLYGANTASELIGTKLMIAFQYLKMMIIPYPMAWDYSFNQIPLTPWTETIPLITILSYLFILLLAIYYMFKRPEISLGFVFFITLITPTANIFFLNGTTFADRFLFLPSLGFIIAIVFLIHEALRMKANNLPEKEGKIILTISGIILMIFSVLSIDRTKDWENNYSVFKSGVENSPNSSRTNDGLATTYMNLAQEATEPSQRELYIDSAILFYEKSLSIFPENSKSAYGLAYIYSIRNRSDSAIKYYRKSLDAKPDYIFSLNNLGTLYANTGKFDSAYGYFMRSYDINDRDELVLTNLTVVCLNLQKTDESIRFGERALSLGYSSGKLYSLLSTAYARKGDLIKSKKYEALAQMKNVTR